MRLRLADNEASPKETIGRMHDGKITMGLVGKRFSYLKGTTCVTCYTHASSHPIQTNNDSRRNGRHVCSLATRFHLEDANVGKRVHLAGTGTGTEHSCGELLYY